jgi:hypothetical protein
MVGLGPMTKSRMVAMSNCMLGYTAKDTYALPESWKSSDVFPLVRLADMSKELES